MSAVGAARVSGSGRANSPPQPQRRSPPIPYSGEVQKTVLFLIDQHLFAHRFEEVVLFMVLEQGGAANVKIQTAYL